MEQQEYWDRAGASNEGHSDLPDAGAQYHLDSDPLNYSDAHGDSLESAVDGAASRPRVNDDNSGLYLLVVACTCLRLPPPHRRPAHTLHLLHHPAPPFATASPPTTIPTPVNAAAGQGSLEGRRAHSGLGSRKGQWYVCHCMNTRHPAIAPRAHTVLNFASRPYVCIEAPLAHSRPSPRDARTQHKCIHEPCPFHEKADYGRVLPSPLSSTTNIIPEMPRIDAAMVFGLCTQSIPGMDLSLRGRAGCTGGRDDEGGEGA
ncbi:hypothetical protein MKEN_00750300 [Mycena kentingensis (nom. inval.)]|nr:hypothetical protein MKEN_00750300 [Mycena kentingensis (nom. inval.)]